MKKNFLTVLGTGIGNYFGVLYPALILFIIVMFSDYISGILVARKEAIENSDNIKYGLNSKKGILGIYKKIGYILAVFVSICIDYMIFWFSNEIGISVKRNTLFGLLVTIWFVLNEIISILENIKRMGVKLPKFLMKFLNNMQKNINDKNK
ncbi:MAG: phage holin family protein [Lachnospiraceae bacterium]|nr:phage holin family protein [Lachnospiraceae bacterium]